MRSLVWFRERDLRTEDHGPLAAASEAGEAIPCFVLEAGSRRQVLGDALGDLGRRLEALGSRLLFLEGPAEAALPAWAGRWKVDQILAHSCGDPAAREREARVERALGRVGIPLRLHEGETLVPPGSLRTGNGGLHSVFTAFARAFAREGQVGAPLPPPVRLPPLPAGLETAGPGPESSRNALLPEGGESAARLRLDRFLAEGLPGYHETRDRLDLEGTSRLSMDLHLGALSVRDLWHRVSAREAGEGGRAFLRQLLWREFAHHWLWERPDLLQKPFRAGFEGFPWREDEAAWHAWTLGRTGYPLVDAAARQLAAEGFVHNRARMVAACFLAKDLLLDFRRGEAHYLDRLVDADEANNDLGWQWSAGCGCDAQPWFRVFNPVLQGRRFDPDGAYVRRWVPELAHRPAARIHEPGPEGDYPPPVVDLAWARARFLEVAKAHLAGGHSNGPAGLPD